MPTPTQRAYTTYRNFSGYPKEVDGLYQTGYNSDKVNGKLLLTDHPHYFRHDVNTSFWASSAEAAAECPSTTEIGRLPNLPYLTRSSAKSETYARLRGKLYQGSAALGVSLGSVQQSREMISRRYAQLSASADQLSRSLAHTVAKRKVSRSIADGYLEWVFGWKPALADIHNAALTVCQLAPITGRVRASVTKVDVLQASTSRNRFTIVERVTVQYRCTRSAMYKIDNPNLWLAERAGLINPAAVAWDLVPWSFVVNMFVNTGQLVGSITDFAGVTFPSSSITETARAAGKFTCTKWSGYGPGYATSSYIGTHRERGLDGTAVPPLTLRMPNVNWELAAIAASLFTQKFSKISSTINNLRKGI